MVRAGQLRAVEVLIALVRVEPVIVVRLEGLNEGLLLRRGMLARVL
jgi:hypothetical protein